MAGTLKRVSRLPLWPRFTSAQLFLAHEADLAAAMARTVESSDELSGHVLGFANSTPVDLSSILVGLSDYGRLRLALPVPAGLVMAVLRALESMGVQLPFRSDSLLGLVESAKVLPGQELLAERGIEFRPLVAP
jgi:hypothetical protein